MRRLRLPGRVWVPIFTLYQISWFVLEKSGDVFFFTSLEEPLARFAMRQAVRRDDWLSNSLAA